MTPLNNFDIICNNLPGVTHATAWVVEIPVVVTIAVGVVVVSVVVVVVVSVAIVADVDSEKVYSSDEKKNV